MTPFFNFALTCRFCKDAKCVKACPEKAIIQSDGGKLTGSGILIIDEKKCKGCDWCSQACDYGGITISVDSGKAVACNLCEGEPKCVDSCPEEALTLLDSDEAANKRFNDAKAKLPEQIEKLAEIVKSNNWAPLLEATDKRSTKVAEKLEVLNKKAQEQKAKDKQKQAQKQ
jgi:Fe-S-cluster-containing hydrogenase component 2